MPLTAGPTPGPPPPRTAAGQHRGVTPVLSWADVSVTFGGRKAVDDVTLSVGDGEWVALIGANGSGKSTLTGLTVGLGNPSAGAVRFRGQPVRPGKVFEHAAHVALLLQAADEMLFEETVLRELEFGFRFRARPEHPVLDVPDAIEFFGFAGLEQASPWELSQGGRQRLALAALLVGAPGVLVLDEPTTGQDADHMRAFLHLLDRIRDADRPDRADRHPRHARRWPAGRRGSCCSGTAGSGWTARPAASSPGPTSWPAGGSSRRRWPGSSRSCSAARPSEVLLTVEDLVGGRATVPAGRSAGAA